MVGYGNTGHDARRSPAISARPSRTSGSRSAASSPPAATDLYTLAVRPSEVALPQGGAFLLAVVACRASRAGAARRRRPEPDRRAHGDRDRVRDLPVHRGRSATCFASAAPPARTTLDLHAAGDLNGDGTRRRPRHGGDGGSARRRAAGPADVDGDGHVDSTDSHLVYANLGFSPNQPPVIGAGSGLHARRPRDGRAGLDVRHRSGRRRR